MPNKGVTVAKRGAPAAGNVGSKKSGPPGGKQTEAAKPKARVWTKQDDAARTIQTKYRQHLAKKLLARKKKEKQDYNDLMDKLEKEAVLKVIKMEQEQAEKERKKEEAERRRRKEDNMRKKRMLEAAFDGDIDEMTTILKEVKELDDKDDLGTDAIGGAIRNKHLMQVIECEDANNNTPISEAANGGHVEAITFLLDRGADPNTQGQFKRTPLYRAAFAGHLEACQCLLQNGSDPRIYAADSQTPSDIASHASVKNLIGEWDISQTETLLSKLQADKDKRLEEDMKRFEAEKDKMNSNIAEVQKEYDNLQKLLNKAYCECNKRITEHDEAVGSGFERPELTLQAVHDAEDELEITKLNTEKCREKLSALKLEAREAERKGKAAMADEDLPGVKVLIRELEEVLLRDVGNKIKDSGKWPLLIDPSAQASTFLRYRDTNYLNALSPTQMEPDKVRLALLGAIRFGKPLIIDMMEVDMFDTVTDRFDEISKGLMGKILDGSIKEEQNYLPLVKKSDGADYDKNKFSSVRIDNFKLFIITKNPYPDDKLMEQLYVIRMFVPT